LLSNRWRLSELYAYHALLVATQKRQLYRVAKMIHHQSSSTFFDEVI
jgi:hypothetical protein